MMYVKKDNLIYKICDSVVSNSEKFCTYYNLELICGYDYINSSSNKKEWLSADKFSEELQKDVVVVFIDESFEFAIEDKECILLKELPKDIPFK